jgi:hypothetical protein
VQILGAFYAIASTLTGRLERAEALLYAAAEAPTMRTISGRMLWLGRVDLALARGEPQDAQAIIDELYKSALNLVNEGDIPQLAWRRAQAQLALGNPEMALRTLNAAVAHTRERGFEYDIWRMHREIARVQHALGNHAAVDGELATARHALHALAASLADLEERAAFIDRAEAVISTFGVGIASGALANASPKVQSTACAVQ